MAISKTLTTIAALLTITSSVSYGNPAIKSTAGASSFAKFVSVILEGVLASEPIPLDPIIPVDGIYPADAVDENFNEYIFGYAVMGPSSVELKGVEESNEITRDDSNVTAMLMWSGSFDSVVWTIPTYNFSIELPAIDSFPKTTLASAGGNLTLSITGFKASVHAEGEFNTRRTYVQDLMASLQISFGAAGEGKVLVNGNDGTWSSFAGNLQSWFDTIWNDCPTQLHSFGKCAANVVLASCKEDIWVEDCVNVDPNAIINPCIGYLENLECEAMSGAQSVGISFLANIVVLLTLIAKFC